MSLTREQSNALYVSVLRDNDFETMRYLVRTDLFFLLVVCCKRRDLNTDFHYLRCREVMASPDGMLDLWFREAGKSSIITFGKTVQDILIDPDETFGIFSHTRPIAKSFLTQIKREFEINTFLKSLFPEILYENPSKDAPVWSLDAGIIVKRKGNPKESTIEAHGLVDGQPTSKHYGSLIYDDTVTRESVTSPEMIEKTTEGWALSLNLGAEREINGVKRPCRKRYIGTRYHWNDTYKTIIERGSAIAREYFPTDKGKSDIDVVGASVLFDYEYLIKKRRDMGVFLYGCQMLQNPSADKAAGFNIDWLRYYTMLRNNIGWNYYLLVDPAGEKKKSSDYTVMVVIATAPDGNYYLIDGVRDKMNLTQRAKTLFDLHRKWNIGNKCGYEKYGMQADIEHIQYVQEQEGYRFAIIPLGGQMPKNDRIRRLVPIFEQGRFYIPYKMLFATSEGKAADFIDIFLRSEYSDFPVSQHDDIFDCMSRICDIEMNVVFPKLKDKIGFPVVLEQVKQYDPMEVPR